MEDKISAEYARLKALFQNVEPTKAELVDDLILKAAFLKVELTGIEDKVKRYGSVERSSKGNVRQSLYYKTYLQSLSVYQSIIRTLNAIIGKDNIDEDDEFDEFISESNE
ncbi:MAG: hypothetical protein M0P99_00130 [Candidatus Cloacimonetes bacterium]|nr:hypothetical protein [Candidatus Cloacimonadota bacterium]